MNHVNHAKKTRHNHHKSRQGNLNIYILQGEASLLTRLKATVSVWAGTEVEAAWVQLLKENQEPSMASAGSRVWLVTPGIINVDHALLYRKKEVSHGA